MGKSRRAQPRELARKLRTIREQLNLSQEEVAKRLQKVEDSVYPGLISRYEHGKVEPSLIVLLEYSRMARVSLETLVDDKLKI